MQRQGMTLKVLDLVQEMLDQIAVILSQKKMSQIEDDDVAIQNFVVHEKQLAGNDRHV